MMIQLLQSSPEVYVAIVLVVVVSIVLHELAHGWAAISRGDDTPIASGHMTGNPLVHMGPFSLLALFIVGIAWGSMPVDHTRMRGRYAEAFVAAAGPAMNLLLAFVSLTALGLWTGLNPGADSQIAERGQLLLRVCGWMNLALCLFNLVPLPPLDGAAILANFSRGYRELLGRPEVMGAASAVFLFMFFIGGAFVFRLAEALAVAYLSGVVRLVA